MNRILLVATLASLAATQALAAAQGPGQPLPGWKCARLNATEAQLRDPQSKGVAILAAPDPGAERLGIASALPFIADPPVEQNGYLKTLRLNGQVGWIKADQVKPYHSVSNRDAVCRVVQYANGTVGSAGL
jgi:hypothetical protein